MQIINNNILFIIVPKPQAQVQTKKEDLPSNSEEDSEEEE